MNGTEFAIPRLSLGFNCFGSASFFCLFIIVHMFMFPILLQPCFMPWLLHILVCIFQVLHTCVQIYTHELLFPYIQAHSRLDMLVLIQLLCGLNFYVCICFSWKEELQETMSCWISLLPVPIARSSWCKHVLYCTFYVCTISSSVYNDCFVSMCQALLCWPFFSIVLVLCASFDIGIVHLQIYIYIHVCVCVISIGAKNAHVKLFTVLLDLSCEHACSCFYCVFKHLIRI